VLRDYDDPELTKREKQVILYLKERQRFGHRPPDASQVRVGLGLKESDSVLWELRRLVEELELVEREPHPAEDRDIFRLTAQGEFVANTLLSQG
jgi:hypothetical protein